MSIKTGKVTIVIPAYNEESVIRGVTKDLPKVIHFSKKTYNITVVVVNDGSTDNTQKVVEKQPRIKLINHVLNSGAGAATRTGLNYAKKINSDYAITMDADGQHLTADVIKLIKEISKNKADLIIGSRLMDTQGMPWYRVIGNKGLSAITFVIFGVFVKDSQSGLRAYNRSSLEKITFHSNHYAFCSEIIWSAKRNKLRIIEHPITAVYSDYSLAKGQSNWGAIVIIKQLLKRRFLSIIHG